MGAHLDTAYVALAASPYRASEGPTNQREDGKRRIVVHATSATATSAALWRGKENIAAEVKVPAGYWLDWGGQFENSSRRASA